MADKKYYLTKEGLEKIKKEFGLLKELRKSKLRDDTPEAFHSEDLNPDYLNFRKDMGFLESKINKLEEVLKNVEIINPPKSECKEVRLGAMVTIEANGQEDEFIMVGTLEADPVLGKISNESPVGKALLGCKEGEEVTVSSPIKTVYKIKKVIYL